MSFQDPVNQDEMGMPFKNRPKRRYTKKAKKEPAIGDKVKTQKSPSMYHANWSAKKAGKEPTFFGQPIARDWTYTAAGWKRSGPEPELLPEHQITRYFKITKTLEEIQESDLPKTQQERSELRVPTLERSDPGVPVDKDVNLPRTMEEYNEFLKRQPSKANS